MNGRELWLVAHLTSGRLREHLLTERWAASVNSLVECLHLCVSLVEAVTRDYIIDFCGKWLP